MAFTVTGVVIRGGIVSLPGTGGGSNGGWSETGTRALSSSSQVKDIDYGYDWANNPDHISYIQIENLSKQGTPDPDGTPSALVVGNFPASGTSTVGDIIAYINTLLPGELSATLVSGMYFQITSVSGDVYSLNDGANQHARWLFEDGGPPIITPPILG